MHEVLLNHLGGLSLPRKSVVRLTDRPDMTLDVYHGRKTTAKQHPVITSYLEHCLGVVACKIRIEFASGLKHDHKFGKFKKTTTKSGNSL